ncbi:sensor histidine kinase N-terminal domain-containing protein [Spongiibacter sp. KMU-158]|uniref:histidine kinase n=1 Tax=Spongiibacter pelagi TaxID=2760804 RepID=A0A927C213_9GAMM|nr:ATP-binding protein [Spongiibacter pelagi]MBD2858351.1 sensor histidine kinase N-terminal domain-containing protein [Spongiibacter pelagi]
MTSLRRFLIISILAVFSLGTFLASLQGYRSSMNEAQAIFDQQLRASAERLLDTPIAQLSTPAAPASDIDNASVFQLIDANGNILWRSSRTPTTPISAESGFSEANFGGYRWRIFSLENETQSRRVVIAERSDLRYRLAESVVLQSVIPVLLVLPATALIIWLIIGYGLRSLRDLAEQLKHKATDDFSAINLESPPDELAPVVSAVNHSLQRLGDAFERERRFSADAAHELRTPISAISMHLHNGLAQPEHAAEALTKLAPDVERLSHLVEQLLLLNRTTAETFPSQFLPIELQKFCREIIAKLYPEFAKRGQQIALLGESATIHGDRFTLQILIENLLRNAMKYCPNGAQIEIDIRNSKTVTLTVRDNGPGIEDKDRERIFERFYRAGGDRHNSGESGCGLGLSIVSRIAELHSAKLSAGKGIDHQGLAIHVDFPQPPKTKQES